MAIETVQDLLNELYKVPANAKIRIATMRYFSGSEHTGEWSQESTDPIARVNNLETTVVLDVEGGNIRIEDFD